MPKKKQVKEAARRLEGKEGRLPKGKRQTRREARKYANGDKDLKGLAG